MGTPGNDRTCLNGRRHIVFLNVKDDAPNGLSEGGLGVVVECVVVVARHSLVQTGFHIQTPLKKKTF